MFSYKGLGGEGSWTAADDELARTPLNRQTRLRRWAELKQTKGFNFQHNPVCCGVYCFSFGTVYNTALQKVG